MKYANLYPVCNDAEHGGGGCWLFILRITALPIKTQDKTVASWLMLYALKARLPTSKVDNCNEVGSQLPHRAHISGGHHV